MKTLEPLGLYVHIPFCVRKCLYCDFLSYDDGRLDPQKYVERLIREIHEKKDLLSNKKILTLYFGGGTPSLLEPKAVGAIRSALENYGSWSEPVEITLEANPGTLGKEKIQGYLEQGVNRFSLGLQSTVDDELKRIGRIHTFKEFLDSYRQLRESGCNNINVDLMTGLPGQTTRSFQKGLLEVLSLKPEHLSCYGLTLEEGTPLHRMVEQGVVTLDEDLERSMYRILVEEAFCHGFEHYEISNFARPGFRSRHNHIYWSMGSYLGLGLGSSSLMDRTRWRNPTDLEKYMNAPVVPREEVRMLDEKAWKEEWMFLGLRELEGISRKRYQQVFGQTWEKEYGSTIKNLEKKGLLVVDETGIRLSRTGLTFANQVFSAFLLD